LIIVSLLWFIDGICLFAEQIGKGTALFQIPAEGDADQVETAQALNVAPGDLAAPAGYRDARPRCARSAVRCRNKAVPSPIYRAERISSAALRGFS